MADDAFITLSLVSTSSILALCLFAPPAQKHTISSLPLLTRPAPCHCAKSYRGLFRPRRSREACCFLKQQSDYKLLQSNSSYHAPYLTIIKLLTQYIYASRIVAVASRGCAKCSVVLLYQRLKFYRDSSTNLTLLLCIAAWSLFSAFALAFQCRFPAPWLISSSNCPSGSSFIIAIAALDVFTDLLLILHPIPALLSLTMHKMSRLKYIAIFSSRIL
jgi:hypothetical protein